MKWCEINNCVVTGYPPVSRSESPYILLRHVDLDLDNGSLVGSAEVLLAVLLENLLVGVDVAGVVFSSLLYPLALLAAALAADAEDEGMGGLHYIVINSLDMIQQPDVFSIIYDLTALVSTPLTVCRGLMRETTDW